MKQSLEKRIILLSFIILSLTILASSAMEIALFRNEAVRGIQLRSQSLGTSLKTSIEHVLALGIDLRDIKGLEYKCRETAQSDPDISYCVITDNNGKALFASDPDYSKLDFPAAPTETSSQESGRHGVKSTHTTMGTYFDTQIPVQEFDTPSRVAIHIGFTQHAVDQKIHAIILRSGIIFLVFFAVSFALVIVFVKRNIVAPVASLLEGVSLVSRGEFKHRIKPLAMSELDQLVTGINNMAVALETRDNELLSRNNELSLAHSQLLESYKKLDELNRDIEHSEELYKKLQFEAGDPIIILDDSGKIIMANMKAETFFGYTTSEIIGQQISSMLERLHTVNSPQHLENIKHAWDGILIEDDIAITNGNFEQLVGRFHASCAAMSDRSLLQIIIRDVTKERDILQNLENSAAGLARINRMKDSFLGLASHELKTPLTVIMGYSELLLTDMKEELTESTSEMIQNISSAANRLDNIVKDMIDVTLIDKKQLELKLGQVDINEIMESTVNKYKSSLETRHQQITIQLAKDLPMIRGDQTRLIQLCSNILGNAIKFTPDGGRISVSTTFKTEGTSGAQPYLESNGGFNAANAQQSFVEIVISDTGIGIAEEDQQRIFEKFYEAGNIKEHSSGKVAFKAGGAALGLSIAKGIIDMHGGRIWVESAGYDSKSCPGSSFFILLPVEQSLT